MDHPDQGPSNAPPQAQTLAPPPAPPQQLQTPQAALAAVTRGENPPPPALPPKTEVDTTRPRRVMSSGTAGEYYEDTVSGHHDASSPARDPYRRGSVGIIPPPPRSIREGGPYTSGENGMSPGRRRRSGLDWIVPVNENDKAYVVRPLLLSPYSPLSPYPVNSPDNERRRIDLSQRFTMLSARKLSTKRKVNNNPIIRTNMYLITSFCMPIFSSNPEWIRFEYRYRSSSYPWSVSHRSISCNQTRAGERMFIKIYCLHF